MLRRSLRRMRRYPSLTLFIAGIPVVLLLLFVYVFGGTLGAGPRVRPVAGARGVTGRDAYVAYVVPGILLLTVVGAAQGTAISVCHGHDRRDHRPLPDDGDRAVSVLAGHVIGSVIQALLATALVLVVAVLIGFRPTTGPAAWLAAGGLLVLAAIGVSWLSVALGLVSDSVETASNLPMFLMLLLFLGSGFVPTASMPGPLEWFAEHQPFTPIIETLRGLLLGTPIGDDGWIAVAWCLVLSLAATSGRCGCTSVCRRALERRSVVAVSRRQTVRAQPSTARSGG